jgi:murein DD-endopeptidase MepM/ murein hydrolase activator NlpD
MKPSFQMPFMCNQKWRASTYDGHAPDQDSIDLSYLSGASAGQPVYASAAGTVEEAHDTNSENPPYGSVVIIDHGDGWKTSYVHLDDQLLVSENQTVVRGQQLGVVGNITGLTPHLHYNQLLNDEAVRIEFNGVLINVHAGAPKVNGNYPTQDLISKNSPTGINVTESAKATAATCQAGAAVRATLVCINNQTQAMVTHRGPWKGANGTSTVKCISVGHTTDDHGAETS